LPRHIGPSENETKEMLKVVKASSLEDLIKQAIPDNIVDPKAL
jgi:glycine cleavage system pyridoxal-binding protein P